MNVLFYEFIVRNSCLKDVFDSNDVETRFWLDVSEVDDLLFDRL